MSDSQRGPLSWIGDLAVGAVERRSTQILLLLAIFLIFGAIDFAIGALVTSTRLPILEHGAIDATLHGGGAVVAAWFILEGARERRARLREQVEESAKLNHEIRNALEVIAHAGYLLNDVVYGRAVAESVERIKKSLDESKPQ